MIKDMSELPPSPSLNEQTLVEAARTLAGRDDDLARVLEAIGPPPLWARPPGFATLIYIILEQQVSLASARAAYRRLGELISPITPHAFLTLDDATLKAAGFSRQKTGYGRILARTVLEGDLDLESLAEIGDDAVRERITRVKGLGRWSADIYLMEALLRPDIWPTGDLALAVAVQRVKGLAGVPKPPELEAIGEASLPPLARRGLPPVLASLSQRPHP
jgi:DNA-3-methyladenine glycosylase II